METITKETATIDGVEYKLFANDRGPAVRVMDVEVAADPDTHDDGVVTIINYPNPKMAQAAYETATEAARRTV